MAFADKTGPRDAPLAGGAIYDAVHTPILRFLPDLVAELGGDLPALLARVGLPADALQSHEAVITFRQFFTLMETAAKALDCPDLGMRLARHQSALKTFGLLGDAMGASRTLGEALHYVAQHTHAHSLAAFMWLKPSPSGRSVFSGHDIRIEGVPRRAQVMEQIMLLGHLGAMELTGGHARVRRVHFRHQPVSPLRVYRRYFGCDVRFGQNQDGILLHNEDMACPIVDSDTRSLEAVTAVIEARFGRPRPPLHAEVRGIMMHQLWTGQCTNSYVTSELNLHARTLHRRLAAEGTSFQQIKDEVRRDMMLYYLEQTDLDFMRVSDKLGFSEQSAMTRVCNQWFGASPSRVRARALLSQSVKSG